MKFFSNPKLMLGAAAVFFLIAFIDSTFHNSSSYSDLTILGKISVIGFSAIFGVLIFKYLIMYFVNKLVDYFK